MSSEALDEQTTTISRSIKDILEFTLNREMKMKCFELLQVDNTYDFSEELKYKLLQSVSGRTYWNSLSINTTVTSSSLASGSTSLKSQQLVSSPSSSQQLVSGLPASQNTSADQFRGGSASNLQQVSSVTSAQQFSRYRENSWTYNSASGSSEPSSSGSSASNTQDSQSHHLHGQDNPRPIMNQAVNGQMKQTQASSSNGTELVSDEFLKSDSQIMAEFLQDIEMLENM
ncbi:hypothetical protein WDU94_001455 [Cyamophila willieti]